MSKTRHINVLLNREEDENGRLAIFTRFRDEDSYQEGDRLESVWAGHVEADSDEDALNLVFEMFNRGAPRFVGDEAYPQRSLSVGDCVEVTGVRYACQSVGWKKLAHA